MNSFGLFDLAIGGVYSTGDVVGGNADSDMYGGGISLGYAGFTFGGNYTVQDIAGEGADRDYFDVGVAYSTGPWGVSLQYANSEQANRDGDYVLAAGTYDLGPGVTAGIYAGYGDVDNGTAGGDADGFLVGTGFALSF